MHGGKGSGAPRDNQNARKHGRFDRQMQQRRRAHRALQAQVRLALASLAGEHAKIRNLGDSED
jgi:hypothetical protein